MLKTLRKWLAPPIFPGEEERNEQARILNSIEHYLFLILALSAVAVPFLTPTTERIAVLGIILGLLILHGISRLILFSGRIELSGNVIATSVWTVDVVVAILAGGISSPMMFSAVIVALVFGLLLTQPVGKILIGMSILAGLGMVILPRYGVIFPMQEFGWSQDHRRQGCSNGYPGYRKYVQTAATNPANRAGAEIDGGYEQGAEIPQ
jgi:hypothetical protein